MPAPLAKMAGMASSSKQRRTASSKQTGAKPQVIAVRRENALPREGTVSTTRRKPVVKPSIGAPTELLTTAAAGANKKPRRVQQAKTSASRPKTAGATGRASNKRGKAAAAEVMPAAEEVSATTALEAPPIAAPALVETEVVVEASAIVEETTIVRAPSAPAVEAVPPPRRRGKRPLLTAVSQLLSALCRWTGIR